MSILRGFQGPQGLNPDVTGTLRGVGQGLMGVRALGRDMQADQLTEQAAGGDMDALAMLGRLDPGAAQVVGGVLEAKDSKEAQRLASIKDSRLREAIHLLRVDPSQRMQALEQMAVQLGQSGEDFSHIVELSGMSPEQQDMALNRILVESAAIDDLLAPLLRGGVPDKEGLDREQRLRQDYRADTQEAQNTISALRGFESVLTEGGGSGASDRALLARALRVFSPEARVTDRGVEAAGAPGNITEVVGGLYEFLRGGGTLTPPQRQELAQAVRATARAEIGQTLQETNQRYTQLAEQAGVRPDAVVMRQADLDELFGGAGPQAQPQPRPRAQPPQPGEVRQGFRFRGGNPADQNNWERVE